MLESLCSENDRKRNVGTTAHRPPSSESCLDVRRVTYLVSFRVKIHGRFPWLAGVSMSCSNAVRGHINTRKSHCDQLKSESLNNTQIQKTMRCCDTILLQSTGENAKIHSTTNETRSCSSKQANVAINNWRYTKQSIKYICDGPPINRSRCVLVDHVRW